MRREGMGSKVGRAAGWSWVWAVLLSAAASAQQPSEPLQLTLDEALRRAEKSSEEMAVARAGVLRAKGERWQALSQWLPQLGASISYDRTLASEFEDAFDFPEPPAGASEEGEGGGDLFSDLPFGQANTWRAGLSFNQSLFSGFRSVAATRLARISTEIADIGLSSSRASVVLEAAQAYYDAVLSERLLAIAEATFAQAEETFQQTKLGRQVGSRPEFDLLRAQVTFENQRPVVLQRRVERNLAFLRLRQLLDLPADRPLVLVSALDEKGLADVSAVAQEVAQVPVDAAQLPRAPVRLAASAVEARESGVTLARSQRYPAVSLISNYGKVNYPADLFPSTEGWRTNWTVGVALQVPLFTGFRITGDVQVAQANWAEARARLQQTEEFARLDSAAAQEQLEAALAVWKASAGTVTQARRAYEIAELRYREGVSTQLELSDARILLQQAEANRARAARDLQVARIRIVLLPNLPLTGMDAAAELAQGSSGAAGLTSTAGQAAGASGGTPAAEQMNTGQPQGAAAGGF